ncbi:hypothetical protein A3F27_03535 [Candidatus Kaiserbacteria bacterium RIFCSPHIGHO2_12_FULL_53_13]|uniref:Thioredoxin domain-containing protein n=1 Tax=Candidatus Kaiserbacteria bacterium RIFCSPHIGHO2_12_FULL_53_13 TaxID=1798502 RepID=A0A1F6EB59_9BACT|nr:MAG: hypothetical protein A3F27_03535 [Candidatus Kaiserbacteria bacterium RIFCSPHIGHO2_12_FULL_53_13]OGG74585.1 MAG: hypothetical protein A3A37_01290 [Candidatus Kaiserbacteria bacterium RIFCSPLOWO2_01_FULL_52_36]
MENPIVGARRADWRSYAVALVITTAIFATALYASNYFNERRIAEIRTTQDNISIDILSLETQFDLLAEHSCRDISENSVLSKEIRPLAERLSYLETQRSVDESELLRLKRYYSLLQIKDLLLMKKVATKCSLKPVFILYFYSNEGDCKDCENQGYALTALSEKYPQLRIYSFDYNLDISALQTLLSINDVENKLPALSINDKMYYGFRNIQDIEKVLPQLATLDKAASSTRKSAR